MKMKNDKDTNGSAASSAAENWAHYFWSFSSSFLLFCLIIWERGPFPMIMMLTHDKDVEHIRYSCWVYDIDKRYW
jgi:hypothetical protein